MATNKTSQMVRRSAAYYIRDAMNATAARDARLSEPGVGRLIEVEIVAPVGHHKKGDIVIVERGDVVLLGARPNE